MKDTMIGVDLAKAVFQLHGASMTGQLKYRMKLARSQFRQFMAVQPPSVVVMEACGSAHFWAREMVKLGHEVKLIAPQYVRPFVKRQKNDTADAEAIVIAAQRGLAQAIGGMLKRGNRDRLCLPRPIHHRTSTISTPVGSVSRSICTA